MAMTTMPLARMAAVPPVCWRDNRDQPDEGIWETRGGRNDFTYGRFQTWAALDRWTDVSAAGRVTPAGTLRS